MAWIPDFLIYFRLSSCFHFEHDIIYYNITTIILISSIIPRTYQLLEIERITLEGNYVLLRPPLITDEFGLSLAAKDGEIWNNPYAFFPTENDIFAFLQDLLSGSNSFLPFIIINKQSNIIVGSTRYLNIDYDNRRMEIGHTWVRKSFRRTAVNTETKLLMLQYAFEILNCIAIEIRTDVLNTVSRRAIERLGAKEDGILRNHKIMKNGRIRDTICYSIIKSEWPLVKENLLQKMNHYDNNYVCPVIREGS